MFSNEFTFSFMGFSGLEERNTCINFGNNPNCSSCCSSISENSCLQCWRICITACIYKRIKFNGVCFKQFHRGATKLLLWFKPNELEYKEFQLIVVFNFLSDGISRMNIIRITCDWRQIKLPPSTCSFP